MLSYFTKQALCFTRKKSGPPPYIIFAFIWSLPHRPRVRKPEENLSYVALQCRNTYRKLIPSLSSFTLTTTATTITTTTTATTFDNISCLVLCDILVFSACFLLLLLLLLLRLLLLLLPGCKFNLNNVSSSADDQASTDFRVGRRQS